MRFPLRGLPAAIVPGMLAFSPPPKSAAADDSQELRFAIAANLDSALLEAGKQDKPERQIAVLAAAAAETLRATTANVLVQETLRKVERAESRDPRASANQWRTAVTEARDILSFKPLIEAPLPVGFPDPTPVGEIRVQHYPAYRLARTSMQWIFSDLRAKRKCAIWLLRGGDSKVRLRRRRPSTPERTRRPPPALGTRRRSRPAWPASILADYAPGGRSGPAPLPKAQRP